jgi:hypothetical protein
MAGLPDLLTIEEAARVIRVGRTKAYAMAREWRATGGKTGLPVVDFGNALRVPRCQLETIVGGPLSAESAGADPATPPAELETPPADELLDESTPSFPPAPAAVPDPDPAEASRLAPRRPSRRRTVAPDQPSLPFES